MLCLMLYCKTLFIHCTVQLKDYFGTVSKDIFAALIPTRFEYSVVAKRYVGRVEVIQS